MVTLFSFKAALLRLSSIQILFVLKMNFRFVIVNTNEKMSQSSFIKRLFISKKGRSDIESRLS